MDEEDSLLLRNQLCFPLYACSRQVIKGYNTSLKELDLTYTQYVAMMVLWEEGDINVKTLGERLYLDSGTLSPLLKSLEQKGYVTRSRDASDSRIVTVSITDEGRELRTKATEVQSRMKGCLPIDAAEAETLYRILYKILKHNPIDGLKEPVYKE